MLGSTEEGHENEELKFRLFTYYDYALPFDLTFFSAEMNLKIVQLNWVKIYFNTEGKQIPWVLEMFPRKQKHAKQRHRAVI